MTRKIEDTCQLEICCFDLESVEFAQNAGVTGIELCVDYQRDGLWPGKNMIREARAVFSGVLSVMIRPRPGDFCYSNKELSTLLIQIEEARMSGANGITFGCLTEIGGVAWDQVDQIIQQAGSEMTLTFHRAIDHVIDPGEAIHVLSERGVHRVLSSGGQGHARDHVRQLEIYQQIAGPTLSIVAAGSVRPEDIAKMRFRGISSVHSSASIQSDGRADPMLIAELIHACGLHP